MTATGIRRVHFLDYFHYLAASSCFDNTTSVVWTAPGSSSYQVWDSFFGGSEALGSNYIKPGAVAAAPTYLYGVDTITPGRTLTIDWGMHYNAAALDAGIYFMAASSSLNVSSYRVKQLTSTVVIERLDASGIVQWSETWSYTPGSGFNYYRLHFFPQDLKLGDDDVAATAGQVLLEAGESYDSMAFRTPTGTALDPAPRTTGGYFGIYQGAGSRPSVTLFLLCEGFYPISKLIRVEHDLRGASLVHFVTLRGEYEEWGVWPAGSIVQVLAYNVDDGEVYTAYGDFLGIVVTQQDIPQSQGVRSSDDKIYLICQSMSKFFLNMHLDITGLTGSLTDAIAEFLEGAGGNHWAGHQKSWGAGAEKWPKNINLNFAKDGGISVIDRFFKGQTCDTMMRDIGLAEDYYLYETPEGAIKFTDVWRDMTSFIIDTGEGSRLMWYRAVPEDLTQMTNESSIYRSGMTKVDCTNGDTTSQASYGVRQGGPRTFMSNQQINGDDEAEAIANTDVNRHSQKFKEIDLYFLTWGMPLRPGDLVSLSMPQLRIGGDYETPHDDWEPETWAVLAKTWDSENAIIHLRLGKTRYDADKALTVGLQDHLQRAADMIAQTHVQARRAEKANLL